MRNTIDVKANMMLRSLGCFKDIVINQPLIPKVRDEELVSACPACPVVRDERSGIRSLRLDGGE